MTYCCYRPVLCQNQKMPVRALRPKGGGHVKLSSLGSESKNARKGIKTFGRWGQRRKTTSSQNQKMPVRALRRSNIAAAAVAATSGQNQKMPVRALRLGPQSVWFDTNVESESKNARKGIKTNRWEVCRTWRRHVPRQNQKMPVRALRPSR